jgi:hypothetical protein
VRHEEVELIRGEYADIFHTYIVGVFKNKVFGIPGDTGYYPYIKGELLHLVYRAMVKNYRFDLFLQLMGPEDHARKHISEMSFVSALTDGILTFPPENTLHLEHGRSALHLTIVYDLHELARWLVDHGGRDVNTLDHHLQSPLYDTLSDFLPSMFEESHRGLEEYPGEKIKMAKFLITRGASVVGFPHCVQVYAQKYQAVIHLSVVIRRRCSNDILRRLSTFITLLD